MCSPKKGNRSGFVESILEGYSNENAVDDANDDDENDDGENENENENENGDYEWINWTWTS